MRSTAHPGVTLRAAISVVVVAVLVAAACTSDGASDDSASSTDSTTTTASIDDRPTTTASDTTPPAVTQPANFASFRGVTESSISVGVAVPDFDALQAAGIQNYQGSAETAFSVFFDRINEAGGVAGRMLEPVYVDFSFVDPVSQDEACVALAEDQEVFIVFYGLLSASNLCLTEIHDTMVITDQFQTTELRERSGDTAWLQLRAADDALTRIMGQVVAESGRLDGRTVGIIANGSLSDGIDGIVLQDTLAELGHDAVVVTTTPSLDITEAEAELRVFAERLQSEGVDFVFSLLGGGDGPRTLADAGFSPPMVHSNLRAAVDSSTDPAIIAGGLGVGARPEEVFWDDPDFRAQCVDPILAAHPELDAEFAKLATGEEQARGEPNWANPTRIACNQTLLFQRIAELVGADLTNESFVAALDELGPIELPGYGQMSFTSAGKWDGLDEFVVQEYDAATDQIVIVGDPIVVDR